MRRKPRVIVGSASYLNPGISTTAIGTQKSFIKRARFNREWPARS